MRNRLGRIDNAAAGTTRQSVMDTIKKVKEKLTAFEKELHVKEMADGIYNLANQIGDSVLSAKLKDIIGR